MNLYQIALPDTTVQFQPHQAARNHARQMRDKWVSHALSLAGGYTELGSRAGAWSDPMSVDTVVETMHWYQVATDTKTMGSLVEIAFDLFPDQKAIFYANVGRAIIMPRHERTKAPAGLATAAFDVVS